MKKTLVLLMLLSLQACFLPQFEVTALSQVGDSETLLVGEIRLDPPLRQDEQKIAFTAKNMRNAFFLIAGDRYYTLENRNPIDFTDTFAIKLQKNYFIKASKNKPLHISGGFFYRVYTGALVESMVYAIEKGVKVDLQSNDRAVYIGTITFKRDEFFNIKEIDVSQKNYKKVNQQFKKKFSTKLNLRVADLADSE